MSCKATILKEIINVVSLGKGKVNLLTWAERGYCYWQRRFIRIQGFRAPTFNRIFSYTCIPIFGIPLLPSQCLYFNGRHPLRLGEFSLHLNPATCRTRFWAWFSAVSNLAAGEKGLFLGQTRKLLGHSCST